MNNHNVDTLIQDPEATLSELDRKLIQDSISANKETTATNLAVLVEMKKTRTSMMRLVFTSMERAVQLCGLIGAGVVGMQLYDSLDEAAKREYASQILHAAVPAIVATGAGISKYNSKKQEQELKETESTEQIEIDRLLKEHTALMDSKYPPK